MPRMATPIRSAFPVPLERRAARRFAYPAVVRIDRQTGAGIDISTNGVSVLLAEPVPVGRIVVVALGGGDNVNSRARVVRMAPMPYGVIVGLQFVD